MENWGHFTLEKKLTLEAAFCFVHACKSACKYGYHYGPFNVQLVVHLGGVKWNLA